MRVYILFPVAALALLQLAAAQPRYNKHQHLHAKRAAVTTQIQYVTAEAPDVIVYVDQYGNPLSTAPGAVAAAPSPVPVPGPAPVPVAVPGVRPGKGKKPAAPPVYPAPAPVLAPAPVSAPSPVAPKPVAPPSKAPIPAPATAGQANTGFGIVYSPYTASGGCKTQAQVNADFARIQGYDIVRIYGVDCNQLNTVGDAAKAKGMKVFAGIFDINQVASEAGQVAAAIKAGMHHIDVVSVGNELVNSGQASVGQVVGAIGTARAVLKAAGYQGRVVTVDTFNAIIANPELCHASDFAAANCHAFFDGNIQAPGAGAFVASQKQRVSEACGGKETWITESGWPSQGGSNGNAVPSEANQQAAIASLKTSVPKDLILFTAFNDLWKHDSSDTFGCEKYYGIYGNGS